MSHRLYRAVELTEVGQALAPGMRDAFTQLTASWTAARHMLDDSSLTVTAGPAFTAKWLAPRLYEFAQAHPEIELRFSASLRNLDFNRDRVDVAIRFGRGVDSGLWSLPLANEWITPVMTPDLARRFPTPDSLTEAALIVDQSIDFLEPAMNWASWFRAKGVPEIEPHGPRFSQADHAVDAALAGVGVVLGRRALVVKDLHDGRLVAPYDLALDVEARFRFLCREGSENRPKIKAFREWMVAEIEKTAYVTENLTVLKPESRRRDP